MNKLKILMIMALIIVNQTYVLSLDINLQDNYNYDQSSYEDHVDFEGGSFSFQAVDINYANDPDLVCFNVDYYGDTNGYSDQSGNKMDRCVYTSLASRDQCISCYGINLPTSEMSSSPKLELIITGKICDGCEWDTSNDFGGIF